MREVLFSLREAHSLEAKIHRESAKHLDNKHFKKIKSKVQIHKCLLKIMCLKTCIFLFKGHRVS